MELLPGPRDREGLPKSIRFWKTRIEETDPATRIRIRKAFWLSDRQVTTGQFHAFLDDRTYQFEKSDQAEVITPSSDGNKNLPVRAVSWYNAVFQNRGADTRRRGTAPALPPHIANDHENRRLHFVG